MKTFTIDGHKVAQITLPHPDDTDPHPYLTLGGSFIDTIPTGSCFIAWLPSGWAPIRLEIKWSIEGPGCWYIPGRPDLCPVGLFVQI